MKRWLGIVGLCGLLATAWWLGSGPDGPESTGTEELGHASTTIVEQRPVRTRKRAAAAPIDASTVLADTDTDADADESVLILRVVDDKQRPLEGVFVNGPSIGDGCTDELGEVSYDMPEEGGLEVRVPSLDRTLELVDPVTVVTWPGAVPVLATFVDQVTFEPLAVQLDDGRPASSTHRVGWTEPGAYTRILVFPRVPEGWVWGWRSRDIRLGETSRHATEFRVTLLVHRELRLRVNPTLPDGTRASGADVSIEFRDGDSAFSETVPDSGPAEFSGLRFVAKEPVKVKARLTRPSTTERDSSGEPLQDVFEGEATFVVREALLSVDVPLKFIPPEPVDPNAPFKGPGPGGLIGIGGSLDGGLTSGGAKLDVVVRERGGSPLARALVVVNGGSSIARETDENGRVAFEELTPGDYEVWLLDAGLTPTLVRTTVSTAKKTTVELRESPGRDVTITVRDSDGSPVVGAQVGGFITGMKFGAHRRSRWKPTQIDDGVQQLRVLSDREGRVRVTGLPIGMSVTLMVFRGGLDGEVVVDERAEVDVTLK